LGINSLSINITHGEIMEKEKLIKKLIHTLNHTEEHFEAIISQLKDLGMDTNEYEKLFLKLKELNETVKKKLDY